MTITGVTPSAAHSKTGLASVWKRVGRFHTDGEFALAVDVRAVGAENEFADLDVVAFVPVETARPSD